MERKCGNLLSYIANELDGTEQLKFTEHLKHCSECEVEYKDLIEVWDTLQFDFEEQDVPKSLKSEVINFVVENDRDQKYANESSLRRLKNWGLLLQKQFTPITASLVLILLVITVGLVSINTQLRNEQAQDTNKPIEIISSFSLKSADQNASNANGNIFIVKQGDEKKLIIQVSNMPKLEGTNVYQAWLLKDGERQNAGTFVTDKNGSGVLTYQLSKGQSFDNIGITMEPDNYGDQPRGKKVVGT